MKIQSYKDLIAWQESHKLVLAIYKVTKTFPREEQFGLVNQLRRAAVSITSNIAEGFSRNTFKEKQQFYQISKGSLLEVDSQMLIARDIGYLSRDVHLQIESQINVIGRLITGLIRSAKLLVR